MKRFPALLLLLAAILSLCACQTTGQRIAVMDFENNTGEKQYQFLESAIPEYITADLVNSGRFVVLERQDIQRYLAEIDFDLQDLRRLSRWQTLGKRVGADYLVAGSVSRLQNNFILTARIFDVGRARILPESAIVGTCVFESQLFERARSIADQVTRRLTPSMPEMPIESPPQVSPETPPASPTPETPELPEIPTNGEGAL